MPPVFLVTGGSGLLGSALLRVGCPGYDLAYTYLRHPVPNTEATGLCLRLDDDGRSVQALVRDLKPSTIVHTAGLRSPGYCESHPEEARRVNVEGTRHLAEAASQVGARFVHISTASVFDGKKMYREEDHPNPVNTYGRTKLQAEEVVRDLLPDGLIVRTSRIYGKSIQGQSLAELVLAELSSGRTVEMSADTVFSPILSDNLAEGILELARRGESGVYHVAGTEQCTAYEFALAVAEVFDRDDRLVRPVGSDQLRSQFQAPRSKNLSLDLSRAQRTLRDTCLLGIRKGLNRFRRLLVD